MALRYSPNDETTSFMPTPSRDGNQDAEDKKYLALLLMACIFVFIARQTLLVRQRSALDYAAVDGFAAVDIASVFLAASVLFLSGSLFRTWPSIRKTHVFWLFAYYVLCALSFIWSVDPVFSLYRSIEYIVFLFAAFAAFTEYKSFLRAERAFLTVTMMTILLQMSMVLRFHGLSLSMLAWHTNTYTCCSAVMFCYCLGEYLAITKADRSEDRKRVRRLQTFGVISLMTLAAGTSAASNVAAAAGCLMIFLFLRRISLFVAGFIAALLALTLSLLFGGGEDLVRAILFPGKSQYALDTASGRTQIWDFYWRKFLENPIIGSGFQVVSSGRDRSFQVQSHNTLFSVLTGTGLIGFALFTFFSLRVWWSAFVEVLRKRRGTVGFVGALTVSFVNSLGMPLMADRWETSSIVFVALIALFVLYIKDDEQETVESCEVLP